MVTFIVINYHNQVLTARFVNEELSKLDDPFSLVVVNNGSTPETDSELSLSLKAPIVDIDNYVHSDNDRYIISSQENLGFARGNNLAASFAKKYLSSEYLLFSNNDIWVKDSNVLSVLKSKIQADERIGLIGPKVIGLNGECQSPEPYQSFWDRYVWMYLSTPFYSVEAKRKRFNLDYSENAGEGFHYKVMGSFFMMPTSIFFEIGGMDPNTFLYSEEVILTERLKRINKQPYYAPVVSVVHAHGSTTKVVMNNHRINKYRLESESYYYHEYMHDSWIKIAIGSVIFSVINFIKR